jgi:SAM-dependent methyltransferase
VLCLLCSLALGLDFVACYLAANISNPFVAPFLITLEVEVGSLVTTGHHAGFTLARAKETGIFGFVWQAGVGSVIVGFGFAALGAALTYAVAENARRARASASEEARNPDATVSNAARLETAVLRTLARYRGAPIADRMYVAGKLRSDPLTNLIADLLPGSGRLLDAGAGRGQFGLLCVELGHCQSLCAFDADPRKVLVCRAAAGPDARVELRDLLDLPRAEFDTVLLLDVLHYLPRAEQQQLLGRVAASLPRGRIFIRELDAIPGARSLATRASEWLAKISGYHRGRSTHHYRPASEIVAELGALHFTCEVKGAAEGTPFGNVLIIATR